VIYALYSPKNIIGVMKSRKIKCAGYIAHMGKRRDAYRALVRNPKGRRPLERRRRRWGNNIKMDLEEV
jgi:hypothetical protein